MNWQTELNHSFTWILTALFWLTAGFFTFCFALKRTTFGKKFSLLNQACIDNSSKIKLIGLILILFTLILLEVRMSVLNTYFYNGLYSALQDKQREAFWFFATINAMLVIAKIIHSIINYFLRQVFEIRWLEKLNHYMLQRWLNYKNYYRLKYTESLPDNIDQRIEQDAREFITGTVDLVRGMINSIVSTLEFTLILWNLSGLLILLGVEIPKGVVFFIYLFIISATAISIWIGYPLIKLNFAKERFHGDYRYSLIRVRDNAESIAFYQGENQERSNLNEKFNQIIQNRWQIVRKMLGLDGFNTGVTQVAMFLPLMLQAPRFFSGQVTLGDMHQTVQSFNRLMRALSFFRLFYEEFTLYQARLDRLSGFITKLDDLDNTEIHHPAQCTERVVLRHFSLKDQQDRLILQNINLALSPGDALLIQGRSGIGKTTLLKAIAGIYPFETIGYAECPCANRLFLPQRPYVPQGTLRQAICYPDITSSESELRQTMQDCQLEKYIPALEMENDWQVILSPGELQRIAFIRILLAKPEVIFLDETTSALDEPTEHMLYQLVKTRLPQSMILSIGHRSSLTQFHNKQLMLT